MAGLSNFYRGDTKSYAVSFSKNKLGINIANQILTLTLKTKKTDTDANAVLIKSITFPDDVNSQEGKGTFLLTKEDTEVIDPGTYYYDFQLVNPSTTPSWVTTLGSGRVEVLTDISVVVA